MSLPALASFTEVLTAYIRNKVSVEFPRGKYPVILLENRWLEPIRMPVDLILPSRPDPDYRTRVSDMFGYVDKAVGKAFDAIKTQIVDDDGHLRFRVDSLTVQETYGLREFVGGLVATEFLAIQGPLEDPKP